MFGSPDPVRTRHVWPKGAAGGHTDHWQGRAEDQQRPELLPVSDCEPEEVTFIYYGWQHLHNSAFVFGISPSILKFMVNHLNCHYRKY